MLSLRGLRTSTLIGSHGETDCGPKGGLGQANILLPQFLAGSGVSSVVLTIGDTSANTVYITIRLLGICASTDTT